MALTDEQQAALDAALQNPAAVQPVPQTDDYTKQTLKGLAGLLGKPPAAAQAAVPPPQIPQTPQAQPFVSQQQTQTPPAFKDILHNATRQMQQQTGFDIHQPYDAINLRALQNPSANQQLKPFPEQQKAMDPLTGTPITADGYKDAQESIYQKQQSLHERFSTVEDELQRMQFNPTEHHTSKGSEIAAGITLLLGTLLGRRSPALSGGLLSGLTNTVQNIQEQHDKQYLKEADQYKSGLTQKQLELAALKDQATMLDSMANTAERHEANEIRRAYENQKWQQFQTHEANWVSNNLVKNGVSQERAKLYAQQIRNSAELGQARIGLGYVSVGQRMTAERDLNAYHMADILVKQKASSGKLSDLQKRNLQAAQDAFKSTMSQLNAEVGRIQTTPNLDDDARQAQITQAFAAAHGPIEAELSKMNAMGIDVSGYTQEADAEAGAYRPPELDDPKSASAFGGFTQPAQAPVNQYFMGQPGGGYAPAGAAPGGAPGYPGAAPQGGPGAPQGSNMGIPPPAGVPAQGGATPSTPGASTAASTAPKTPQLDPNTDPRFAPTWQSTSPEEQRKIIQQVEKSNPANANLPWMKANLKPEPKQAPAVSHPAVPPVSQNELHTKHQQSKPNPAQTPPKPPGIVLPVLQNGKITYEPWQKDIPMPRDPSQLYGHNPNGGGYFWDPQQHTFRYVEGAENPIPHITEGFKAVFGHNREEDHLNSLKGRPQNAQQPQPRIVTPF